MLQACILVALNSMCSKPQNWHPSPTVLAFSFPNEICSLQSIHNRHLQHTTTTSIEIHHLSSSCKNVHELHQVRFRTATINSSRSATCHAKELATKTQKEDVGQRKVEENTWTSMSTRSKSSCRLHMTSNACCPSPTMVTTCPCFSSCRLATF